MQHNKYRGEDLELRRLHDLMQIRANKPLMNAWRPPALTESERQEQDAYAKKWNLPF